MPTSHILRGIQIYHMVTNVVIKFGWSRGRNGTLKIIAAYMVLLKEYFKMSSFLPFLADSQKSDSLYDYDTLHRFSH